MFSNGLDEHRFIQEIVFACYTDYLTSVEYKFIWPALQSEGILTWSQLSELKVKNECQQNRTLFLEIAPRLGINLFKKLINVLLNDYSFVAEKMIAKFNSLNAERSATPSPPSSSLSSSASASSAHSACQIQIPTTHQGSTIPIQTTHSGFPELPQSTFHLSGNECQADLTEFLAKQPQSQTQNQAFVQQTLANAAADEASLRTVTGAAQGHGVQDSRIGIYAMNTEPRGLAFIISNEKFDHFKEREGTEKDRDSLAEMFHLLGWHVTTQRNLTAVDMDYYLKKLARHKTLPSVSALAVAILTHGLDCDVLFGTDGYLTQNCQALPGTFITRTQLMQYFTCSQCPGMEGKPKWFILQACRGTDEDIVTSTHPTPAPALPIRQSMESDAPNVNTRIAQPQKKRATPDTSDMCFLFSSAPGYKAYRKRHSGSPFISALTKSVAELSNRMEIDEIMREVRLKLAREELSESKMTLSEFSTLLLKKWYFKPKPLRPPPQQHSH